MVIIKIAIIRLNSNLTSVWEIFFIFTIFLSNLFNLPFSEVKSLLKYFSLLNNFISLAPTIISNNLFITFNLWIWLLSEAISELFKIFWIRIVDTQDEIIESILNTKIDLLEKIGGSNVFNSIIDDLKSLDDKIIPLVFGLGFSISSFIIGAIIIIKYYYIMLISMLLISWISTPPEPGSNSPLFI